MHAVGAACLSVWLLGCDRAEAPVAASAVAGTGVRFLGEQGAGDDGFARASAPKEFRFPEDHGPHPGFRTEWWYFTGNLRDEQQRHYGFEVTFFRVALAADGKPRASSWAARQIWMAHFALTDTADERFMAAERLARGALGLAGARAEPLQVWVKDWSVEGYADAARADLRLRASDGPVGIDLELRSERPPVLQGNAGLDAKGPEPGNASYYYSWPRLEVAGELQTERESVRVTGQAWMDREWGTSALSAGIAGWDWFALHLSDGRSLMFYRLRDARGAAAPFSSGTLTDSTGVSRPLGVDDVIVEPLGWWTSEVSRVRYPVRWRLAVPGEALELDIEPYLANQELNLSVRYWEGAVRAQGTAGGAHVEGEGYLELAGY